MFDFHNTSFYNFKSANISRDFKGEEGGTRKSRKRAAEREEQLEYRRSQIMLENESSASNSINNSVPSKDVDVVSEHQKVMVIRNKRVYVFGIHRIQIRNVYIDLPK